MDTEQTIELTFRAVSVALWTSVGLVGGFLAAVLIAALIRVIARGKPVARFIRQRCRRPFLVIGTVVGTWIGFVASTPIPRGVEEPTWRAATQHTLLIVLIATAVWLAAGLIRVAEDVILARLGDDATSGRSRRIQTQSQVIRRVAVAVVVIIGIAGILLTFPGARAAGASILASAGIISVVAGLAAQTTLGSVFAGLQIALTDSLRVDDIVIVEEEFGYIEEITLTYVVVRIWDDRRMVMPSTYFTTTPFENWTRRAPSLLGTVELDVDWRVPIPAVRAELERLLGASELWDHRVGVLQVYDATGGFIRIRALVSAKDAPTITDLKYYLRESLVDWLQTNAPYALPRSRVDEYRVTQEPDGPALSSGVLAEEMAELSTPEHLPPDELAVDTLTDLRAQEDPERRKVREAAARRARRRAEREDRKRVREGLPVRHDPRPRPSVDKTVVMNIPLPERTSLKGRTVDPETATEPGPTTSSGSHPSAFFTGSPEAEKRAEDFSGPSEEVYTERQRAAERRAAEQTGEIPESGGDQDEPATEETTAEEQPTSPVTATGETARLEATDETGDETDDETGDETREVDEDENPMGRRGDPL
ncbi:mechanosensitive ion channel family protein [Georgenia alba]|uniref:Mechanosensitive ion channel domain-containing protein n=1 Tax=Georgenia alba TaxID=2233858 RepID=A0ABW2QIR7_9MICO